MTRLRTSLLALSLAALAAAAMAAVAPANAMGKIRCDRTNIAAVALGSYDPIVNHNGTGSAHEHQFFGNIAWHSLPNPNMANYADLVEGTTTAAVCSVWPTRPTGGLLGSDPAIQGRDAARRAAHPGQAVHGLLPRLHRADLRPRHGFSADTRLVATDDLGTGAHGWNCGEFSRQARREGTVNHIPDCSGERGGAGYTLTAHITFPSCWDGALPNHPASAVGDTSDTAHYRYPAAEGSALPGSPGR